MDSCIINGLKRFGSWCAYLFCNSIIGRVCISIAAWFGKLYKTSLLCRFFAHGLQNEVGWRGSAFYKVLHFPIWVLERIAKSISGVCARSVRGSSFVKLFDNWELITSRVYGYIVLCYAITETLLLWGVYRDVQTVKLCINAALVLVSIFMILLNRSPKSIYKGSLLLRGIGSFFHESSGRTSRLFLEDADIRAKSNIVSICVGVALGALGFLLPFQLFAIVVGGIFVALVIFRKLEVGVFLVVAATPFLPTMALVGLSLLCLLSLLLRVATNADFKLRHNGLTPYVVFFVIAVLFGTLTSFTFKDSAQIALVYLSFIAFYFVLVNTVTDRKMWRALAVTFIAAAVLVGLYGVAQNFLGVSSTQSWVDQEMFTDIKLRVYSTFDNPNVLGEFLVITIPVALALFWANRRYGQKLAYVLACLVLAACMIFTWSRGAWLGVMIAVVLFVLIMDKRFFLLGVVGLLFIPVLLGSDNPIATRLLSIGNTSDTSTAYRLSIWMASLNMIQDFWVGGIGLGSNAFYMIYPKYAFAGANFALHSHNLFLQLWVEMGIVGIVSFLALVVATVKQGCQSIVTRGRKNMMNACMIALVTGLLGYLFQGMTDNVWYNYKMVLVFWTVLGLIASGASIADGDRNETIQLYN